jgi:hypothetical protein
VIKLLLGGILDPSGVVALDVLPGIAAFAVHGVAVIVGKVADALDGVRLFIDGLVDGERLDGRDGEG